MEKIISTQNNKMVTNTQIIAKHFGRSHNELIHALRFLKQDCGTAFSKKNFFVQEHNSLQWVTCAGFLVLSGLFTGARDARIKITFIDAFAKAQEEKNRHGKRTPSPIIHNGSQSSRPLWGKMAHYHNIGVSTQKVLSCSITAR